MLDLDRLACDACRLRCDSAKNVLGMLLHAYFVLSRRILDHLWVGRDRTKGRQDRQHGDSGADPLGQGDSVLDSFPGEFRPVCWYQDIGIHRLFLIRTDATRLARLHWKLGHYGALCEILRRFIDLRQTTK